MDEKGKMEGHLSSAVAFVEGGIQDACDDACSICLEDFFDSDPSTVTSCKHEFHLQCILEWCQRSAHCPMCWQHISLKDPTSQELLEAVEQERSIRSNQTRNTAIFHHPALGDFELQHLPVGANDAELEDRIMEHLAVAAAMGRAHTIARREGRRGRSGAPQGRTQFLVFSTHPDTDSSAAASTNSSRRGEIEPASAIIAASSSHFLTALGEDPPQQGPHTTPAQADQVAVLPSGSTVSTINRPILSDNRISAGQFAPVSQDRAGPSDFQSLSESLKFRLNSLSMRYKESITKSTRGWKERWFSRSSSVADLGSGVNAGIATVSRMMEKLETRERTSDASAPHNAEGYSAANRTNTSPDDINTSGPN